MPDPLAAQTLTPLQLRAKLEAMVRRDLLDPAGGPEEEVDERDGAWVLHPRVAGPARALDTIFSCL